MESLTFNTKENQTIERKLLVCCLNTGTADDPVWSPVGKRVEDSSAEYDWGEESVTDILGDTYTSMSAPKITQSFDPYQLDGADRAQLKIWNDAIRNQDTGAMCNNDMLILHMYAGTKDTAFFAERYAACAVKPTSLGGASKLAMPIEVVYGGQRTIGTAAVKEGAITFTPAT